MLGRKLEEQSGHAFHEMRSTVNETNNRVPKSLTQICDVVTKPCTVQNSALACRHILSSFLWKNVEVVLVWFL